MYFWSYMWLGAWLQGSQSTNKFKVVVNVHRNPAGPQEWLLTVLWHNDTRGKDGVSTLSTHMSAKRFTRSQTYTIKLDMHIRDLMYFQYTQGLEEVVMCLQTWLALTFSVRKAKTGFLISPNMSPHLAKNHQGPKTNFLNWSPWWSNFFLQFARRLCVK